MASISDLATHCIRCGFCLESCPTFVVTGKETESPRGRIYLIRSADEGLMDWDVGVREHIDACVGCRACETACPSGVEYGALLELAREQLETRKPSRAKGMLLKGITNPGILRLQLAFTHLWPGKKLPGFVFKAISREAPEAEKPRVQERPEWPRLDEADLLPVRGEVALLQGCAMDVLFPRVQEATRRLLRRVGFDVRTVTGCCGALHAHNGHLSQARQMARAIEEQFVEPGESPPPNPPPHLQTKVRRGASLPLVVNSAGCGSFLKEQSSSAVKDISEFLLENGLIELLQQSKGIRARVTYHYACHLAHGQRVRVEPRSLIKAIPALDYVELDEADMCCGSGGIYNLAQPHLARQLLERKWANVKASGAEIVVSGNPGCHAWLEQRSREEGGSIKVLHTAELLERSFTG